MQKSHKIQENKIIMATKRIKIFSTRNDGVGIGLIILKFLSCQAVSQISLPVPSKN